MNGTCAGGTGAFLDQMALLLNTDVTGLAITDTGYLVVGTQMTNYCNNIYLSYAQKGQKTAKVI